MSNIAIFASGSGSNAENIISYFDNHKITSHFVIYSDNPNAFVLERAKRFGVKSVLFSINDLKSGFVLSSLKENKIKLIVLAGFLKLIPSDIIAEFTNRIINIHPALLPDFGGKGMYGDRVHRAVIDSGEKESGITIHYVNSNYDEGDLIFQAKCPVFPDDTPDSLANRVHELEYKFYPEIIYNTLVKINS